MNQRIKYLWKLNTEKYSLKLLDHVKKRPQQIYLKLLKKGIQQKAKGMSNSIGNKIADKLTKVSKSWRQNNFESETEIIKERYISKEERQQIMDELRLT